MTSAENIDVMMPTESVVANPRTGPVPIFRRITAVISVVRLASTMVESAFSKPDLAACSTLEPRRDSSRMRSKMRMLASTAIPTVRMMPAMPGSVSVAWSDGQGRPVKSSMLAAERDDRKGARASCSRRP